MFVRSEGGFTIFSIMISRIRARIRVDHPSDPRCLGSPLPVVQTSPRIHHSFLDPRADSQFSDFEFEDPRSDVFYHPSDPKGLGSSLTIVQTSPRIYHSLLDPRADSQCKDFLFDDPRSDVFYHPSDPKGLGSSLTVVQTSPRI